MRSMGKGSILVYKSEKQKDRIQRTECGQMLKEAPKES